jgi:hypothetical protein
MSDDHNQSSSSRDDQQLLPVWRRITSLPLIIFGGCYIFLALPEVVLEAIRNGLSDTFIVLCAIVAAGAAMFWLGFRLRRRDSWFHKDPLPAAAIPWCVNSAGDSPAKGKRPSAIEGKSDSSAIVAKFARQKNWPTALRHTRGAAGPKPFTSIVFEAEGSPPAPLRTGETDRASLERLTWGLI